MTTRILILITVISTSCTNSIKNDRALSLNKNSDTSLMSLQHGSVKQIIFYRDNKPISSVAVTPNGNTTKYPQTFVLNSNYSLLAFIPQKRWPGRRCDKQLI